MIPDVIITKVQRDEDGYWTARVSVDGDTVPVTRRFGVWGTVPEGGRWRPILPEFAVPLQKRVATAEKHESAEQAVA